jgi:hypothetical protein
MTRASRALVRASTVLGLLVASGCAARHDPTGEQRGRVVCADSRRTPASLIRSGDRAIDMRWCGPPPFLEHGHWLKPSATLDDVVDDGFPRLGYGLVLADVVSLTGERDPGGWIHTMVQVRIVDAVSALGQGTGPYGAGAVPFRFDSGVARIDGVVVRSPHHERAALAPGQRYLFTYAQETGIQNPWAGPTWSVDGRGRIDAAVGGTRARQWMRALIGRPARAVLDRLARRPGATRYPSILP